MKTEHTAAPAGPAFNSTKEVENNVKARMEKAIGDLQHEAATIRTGRASLSLLDHIRVDYYGTPTPLNQVATLSVPEPSLITISPWDVSQIGPIEKAIRVSDLGLNPANDGGIDRASHPAPHRDEQPGALESALAVPQRASRSTTAYRYVTSGAMATRPSKPCSRTKRLPKTRISGRTTRSRN